MPTHKFTQIVVIYAVTTVVWWIVAPNSPHYDGIVRLLGAGLAFLLVGLFLSHIPAAIVRIIRGSWPAWQVWLSVPFIALFMYFSYVGS